MAGKAEGKKKKKKITDTSSCPGKQNRSEMLHLATE